MIRSIDYPVFGRYPGLKCSSLWDAGADSVAFGTQGDMFEFFKTVLMSKEIDESDCALAEQVHGNGIEVVSSSGIFPGVDGLVTSAAGVNLLIRTADCAAVMLFDPVKKVIGNFHAGWRGVHSNIIARGIELMHHTFGASPAHILAGVSPFIRECCYEVGSEFNDLFDGSYLENRNDRWYLNLWAAISDQLMQSGLVPQNISERPYCTRCSVENFPSFRKTGTRNRILNLIKMETF